MFLENLDPRYVYVFIVGAITLAVWVAAMILIHAYDKRIEKPKSKKRVIPGPDEKKVRDAFQKATHEIGEKDDLPKYQAKAS